jgi:DNA-binding SARP family transcriptional activator/tetratricopeptide (TPR) repeat protein
VLHDGTPVTLPASKRTRALLGYLVATRRAHIRPRICDLLWEGPDDPRAALRWSLWKLRPLIDSARTQRLIADRERVAFEPHGAAIDVMSVRASLGGATADAETSTLESVAKRFRGDFLDGIELPDCYTFQEWCTGEREAYRTLRLEVISTLAARLAGEPERALSFARERAALDPLAEDAHVQVIRQLTRLGRHADAMKQYDACRRILEAELHKKPSAALVQARAAIHAEPVARPASSQPVQVEAPRTEHPLVGREAERRALDALVEAARAGRAPDVVLLVGDPGIGKSRLLEALHDRVREAGGLALAARAFEAERNRAYGPFVDALRDVPLGEAPPEIASDVSHLLLRTASPSPPDADRNRLFEATASLLDWLATRRLVCLSIDDLQWLDEASVALLHYCARRARLPVIFATAARSGELGDNPSALRLVRDLGRAKRLRQLALGPLGRDAIAALVASVVGEAHSERVCTDSEGHPLYALELARARARGDTAPAESVDDLIAERLVHLEDRAQDVLPWMAAMGRTVQPDVLAEATQLPIANVVTALTELERRAVVRTSNERHDFAHDLIRLAAYRRIAAPQRRLIHARIAQVLAARADVAGTWAVDVARHADLGGDSLLCVSASIRACEQYLQVFAYDETEALAEVALRHAARLADAERITTQMELYTFLVHPGVRLHSPGALGGQIADLTKEAADAGMDAQCSRGFKLLATLHHHAFGDIPRARAAIKRAVEVLEKLTTTNAEPLMDAAYCLAYLEADMALTRALLGDLARTHGVESSLGFQWGIGLLHLWDGELTRARDALEIANALASRSKKKWSEFETLAAIAIVEIEAKNFDRVLALGPELGRLAEKLGDDGSEQPFARTLGALAKLARGDDGAEREMDDAVRALERADSRYHIAYVQNTAAAMDLSAGRLRDARRRADAAKRAAEAVERTGETWRAELLLAAVDAREGRRENARLLLSGARPDDLASLPRRTRDILPLLAELIAS